MRHLVPLCVVLLLLLSTPLTAQQQDQLLPSQQLVTAPAAAATDAAAVSNPFDVMNPQQVVAGYDGALVSPAPSLIPGETGTDDIQAQGARSRTCPSGCVVPRNNRRRRSNCQCVTQASRSMKTASENGALGGGCRGCCVFFGGGGGPVNARAWDVHA